ncbi:LysR family transcriptional regulator [Streptomyces sp. NPDC056169]|uniref:LysR family transcriptional regulator n=1 Tax=Streptomyces sp. NPDC056169 TaxID=3345734 RepID=UPI0035DDADEF
MRYAPPRAVHAFRVVGRMERAGPAASCHLREAASPARYQHAYRAAREQRPILIWSLTQRLTNPGDPCGTGGRMELRDIELFLTLAAELHFGRSAERLQVSPAVVSQAIKKQERVIGAQLFERTSRHVRITPTGVVLLQRLKPTYEGIQDAIAAGDHHRPQLGRHADAGGHGCAGARHGSGPIPLVMALLRRQFLVGSSVADGNPRFTKCQP